MHKTFVEYGAELPVRDEPMGGGLQIELEFYIDGFEMTFIDNYEGRIDLAISPHRQAEVAWFLDQLLAKGHIYFMHQVMRVRAVEIRQIAPRNRHTEAITKKSPSVVDHGISTQYDDTEDNPPVDHTALKQQSWSEEEGYEDVQETVGHPGNEETTEQVSEITETEGFENVGEDVTGQGSGVREVDPELVSPPDADNGGEPGSIGI